MYLSLEVVSPQAASLGAERRRTVGPAGLTIGRIPGNDWIFPDPYISKRHARISYSNGAFYVEGIGRNAIAIGSIGNALPANKPQPLRNGDRLFIDQYEIIVTTMQGEPPGASLTVDDPFAVLPAANPSPGSVKGDPGPTQPSAVPDVWNGGVAADLIETGVLDPLAALGGGARPQDPDPICSNPSRRVSLRHPRCSQARSPTTGIGRTSICGAAARKLKRSLHRGWSGSRWRQVT
jgi:predicted component of type VI protein secretion system